MVFKGVVGRVHNYFGFCEGELSLREHSGEIREFGGEKIEEKGGRLETKETDDLEKFTCGEIRGVIEGDGRRVPAMGGLLSHWLSSATVFKQYAEEVGSRFGGE